jgi:predicted DNA-binding protein with PD1-like motif
MGVSNNMDILQEKFGRLFVRQLTYNDDLVGSILRICIENAVRSAVILGAVGGADQVTLTGTAPGGASSPPKVIAGPLIVISLSGIIYSNENGEMENHIHGSFADVNDEIHAGHIVTGGTRNGPQLVVIIGEVAGVNLVQRLDNKTNHVSLHHESL